MRVVCFDLGGVVVRICRDWHEAAERAGLAGPRGKSFLKPDLVKRRMELLALHQCGAISCSAFFEGLAEVSDGNYSPEQVALIHDSWLIGDYDGIADLIDELHQRPDVITACLSNTNESHWRVLTGNHISQAVSRLQHRFASHEMGMIKPDSAIYEKLESALQVGPEQVIFFEDTPENVAAARTRGWNACQIDPSKCTAMQIRAHLKESML